LVIVEIETGAPSIRIRDPKRSTKIMSLEETKAIKWNPSKPYKVAASTAGWLLIGAIAVTMSHFLGGSTIFSETITRIGIGALFTVSVILMIISSKLLQCPQCGMAPLKQDKKVRREPICFICSSCNIKLQTDRIYTKKRHDHN